MRLLTLIALSLLAFTGLAYGQSMELPDVNVLEQLGVLVLSWKGMTGIAKGSIIILILVQIVKHLKADFKAKRLLITVLSIAYGAVQMIMNGASVSAALVGMLVAGGGAIAIYEAIKPLIKNVPFIKTE